MLGPGASHGLEHITCGADERADHKVLLPSGLTCTGWGQPSWDAKKGAAEVADLAWHL